MNAKPMAVLLALLPIARSAAQEPSFHTIQEEGRPLLSYALLHAVEGGGERPSPHLLVAHEDVWSREDVASECSETWVAECVDAGFTVIVPLEASTSMKGKEGEALLRLLRSLIVERSVLGLRFHAIDAHPDRTYATKLAREAPGWFASVVRETNGGGASLDLPEFVVARSLRTAEGVADLAVFRASVSDARETLLESFHRAAAQADEERYFACLADDAVFLGTDPRERWTKEEFAVWALPYFQRESAWIFLPQVRHVVTSSDGRCAWFHEILWSESYGECRGSGTLIREGDAWRIAQYDLTKPIPNDALRAVKDLVDRGSGTTKATTLYVVRHAEKDARSRERDPGLDQKGRDRADELARVLSEARIDALYASEYRRTQDTLTPLARRLDLPVLSHPARDPRGLAERLLSEPGGRRVVIAGHSNTVPAILRALGAAEVPSLTEDDYDDLFVLSLPTTGGRPVLLHLKYGARD